MQLTNDSNQVMIDQKEELDEKKLTPNSYSFKSIVKDVRKVGVPEWEYQKMVLRRSRYSI
jgi:hypothetical protein